MIVLDHVEILKENDKYILTEGLWYLRVRVKRDILCEKSWNRKSDQNVNSPFREMRDQRKMNSFLKNLRCDMDSSD